MFASNIFPSNGGIYTAGGKSMLQRKQSLGSLWSSLMREVAIATVSSTLELIKHPTSRFDSEASAVVEDEEPDNYRRPREVRMPCSVHSLSVEQRKKR